MTQPENYVSRLEATARRLRRTGFSLASAGSLLLLSAPFVPDWQPRSVGPSLVQQIVVELKRGPGQTCAVACSSPLLSFILLWFGYAGLLLLISASQTYWCGPRALAGAAAPVGALLGLLVLVPYVWGLSKFFLVSSSIYNYDLAQLPTQTVFMPNWGVLADSLTLLALGGLLLIVVGNTIAVVAALPPRRT